MAYVLPKPPSPVREGSEEGSSPRASISENGAEFHNVSFRHLFLMLLTIKDLFLGVKS